jgi:DNA-binding NarL/FixJ family response regulator
MATKQEPKAAILCHSSIMKSAIASSLRRFGIDCIDDSESADVAVVVSGMLPEKYYSKTSECPFESSVTRKYVVLTRNDNDAVCKRLRDMGANPSRVPEDIDGEDLGHVVSLAAAGHILAMNNFCSHASNDDYDCLRNADLDESQWQLLSYLSEGLSNKEIAIAEDTTESAIKSRLRVLLQKLGLNNRTKAAVMAARCKVSERNNVERI